MLRRYTIATCELHRNSHAQTCLYSMIYIPQLVIGPTIQFVMCFADAAGIDFFQSMMKVQDCLTSHFMAYKDIVAGLDREWKGE